MYDTDRITFPLLDDDQTEQDMNLIAEVGNYTSLNFDLLREVLTFTCICTNFVKYIYCSMENLDRLTGKSLLNKIK